ncbi:MAG: ParB/RepB/Spo0J family partition protein [Patescibacteria group bacterium]|mgnify:CR=1 FL=1
MDTITEIYADKIKDPVEPMRSELDRDRIFELSESIKREGLINPLTVRSDGDFFEVVAGHRRFRACMIAGVVKIPCVVRELNDDQVFEIRAHENLFREDVDPVDEALYIGKLIGEDNSKIREVAERLNRSVQWVEDRLDIMTYPDYLIASIKNKKISLGVSKWLAKIGDETYRKMFCDRAVHDGMPVWQAEYYFQQWQAGIYKNSNDILPPSDLDNPSAVSLVRVKCERCEQIAEEPNLRSVFIHRTCPDEPVGS